MSSPKHPRKSRIETTRRIIEGAQRALVQRGWQDWGINAIAAEAGVQKVLIYRYFNDLNGLCESLSAELVLFPAEPPDTEPHRLVSGVIRHWTENAFADYVVRLCPILPSEHAFARAFAHQRNQFAQLLENALRHVGHDPTTTQTWIACLLDRSLNSALPPMSAPGIGPFQDQRKPETRPRNLFDPTPPPRFESHDLPVELL